MKEGETTGLDLPCVSDPSARKILAEKRGVLSRNPDMLANRRMPLPWCQDWSV